MLVYTREFDAILGQMKQVVTEVTTQYKSSVQTIADLPTSENIQGDVRFILENDHQYVYINGEWIDQGVADLGDLLQQALMQMLS